MNELDARQAMAELQKPFPAQDIEWRVGATTADKSKGIALAYITNRAIQARLDEVFTPFGWKNEFREWKGSSQICGISIKFEDEWITKWDGASDSNHEATKGGLSDAMKRAGYQWGIGRYLYGLDNIWQPITPAGKSYKLVSTPNLPAWALPEGAAVENKPKLADPPTPTQTPIQTDNSPPAPTQGVTIKATPTITAKYRMIYKSLDGLQEFIDKYQENTEKVLTEQMKQRTQKGA